MQNISKKNYKAIQKIIFSYIITKKSHNIYYINYF